jgi:hypothetical protein
MICDAILFFNENMVFDIRYNELKDVVDKFYVFECDAAFTLKDKPYNFQHQGLPKVEYVKIPKSWIIGRLLASFKKTHPKEVEVLHRLFIQEYLSKRLKPEDLLIFGDADEIPRGKLIHSLGQQPINSKPSVLQTSLYRYSLNLYFQDWKHLFVGRWGQLSKLDSLQNIRTKHSHAFNKIVDAGWHFNNMGTIDELFNKLSSATQSVVLRKKKILDKAVIAKMIEERRAISISSSDNRLKLGQVKPWTELPLYVQANTDKFLPFLIKE